MMRRASFFAASLAGAEPMRTGFTAMRFGWTAYIVPFLFMFSPALLILEIFGERAVDQRELPRGPHEIAVTDRGHVARHGQRHGRQRKSQLVQTPGDAHAFGRLR